ncbi:uncharacterized protein JCM15063_005648 [Sporobolomyces koalae]|uniref:uncharacterized protein n=1 Tax=Sporobolomyces koalae TaxID=500713 RepID=UPI00316E3669
MPVDLSRSTLTSTRPSHLRDHVLHQDTAATASDLLHTTLASARRDKHASIERDRRTSRPTHGVLPLQVTSDHPPAYEQAIERSRPRISQNRSLVSSTTSSTRTLDSGPSDSDSDLDTDRGDATLSNLLNLTSDLLATSSEILENSKNLSSQLSTFLLSSSPPRSPAHVPHTASPAASPDTSWNESLDRLEQDVERFGIKRLGKDPRSRLMISDNLNQSRRTPSTSSISFVDSNQSQIELDIAEPGKVVHGLGLGTRPLAVDSVPPSTPTSSHSIVSTSDAVASAVGPRKRHVKRTSTAQDLLMHISSSSSSSPSTTTSTKPLTPRTTTPNRSSMLDHRYSNLPPQTSSPTSAISLPPPSTRTIGSRPRSSMSPSPSPDARDLNRGDDSYTSSPCPSPTTSIIVRKISTSIARPDPLPPGRRRSSVLEPVLLEETDSTSVEGTNDPRGTTETRSSAADRLKLLNARNDSKGSAVNPAEASTSSGWWTGWRG